MNQNIDVFNVAMLWTKHFGDKDDGLMETALTMILTDAKFWPTVKDINDAITELTAVDYNSAAFKQLGNPSENKIMYPIAKRALEAAKEGKAKEFLAGIDVSDIKGYAKNLFPDISDSLIRKNYNELAFAAEFAVGCGFCKWGEGKAGCETNGYYPVPRLQKEGYIKIEYAPCAKKQQKKYKPK